MLYVNGANSKSTQLATKLRTSTAVNQKRKAKTAGKITTECSLVGL